MTNIDYYGKNCTWKMKILDKFPRKIYLLKNEKSFLLSK